MGSRLGLASAAILTAILGGRFVSLLAAQSLADVARQEEERRKSVKDSSKKVYTNADLGSASAAPVQTAPPASDKPSGPSEKAKEVDAAKDKAAETDKAREKDKEPVKDQAYWNDRMKALRTQLDRDETFAAALQSRIDALQTDFVNRDDPAQRAVIEQDRQKALAELDRLKKSLDADKKALADLQEEARRAGVPPGWLRP